MKGFILAPHAERRHLLAHASPKTTMLHDRTSDRITLDEVEKIVI
jgi:hypothetical protein